MPFVCGDHATVLLLQKSPVSYLRRSNSDAAFTLKDFVLYVLCVSAVLFSLCCDFLYTSCRAIAGKKKNFENELYTPITRDDKRLRSLHKILIFERKTAA